MALCERNARLFRYEVVATPTTPAVCIDAGISIISVDAKLYKMVERYIMDWQCGAARRIWRQQRGQESQAASAAAAASSFPSTDPSFSLLPTKKQHIKRAFCKYRIHFWKCSPNDGTGRIQRTHSGRWQAY
jgi:hypothetical protein